jgi:hypothetical protein
MGGFKGVCNHIFLHTKPRIIEWIWLGTGLVK